MRDLTRRRLLTAAAASGAAVLAGCAGGDDEATASGETTAQASFFVFGEVAAHVAGDAAAADLLVPVGQHGHGWEPGPRVRGEIYAADLFVHGMPGFQPWVDDVLSDLAADDADVMAVDAGRTVDLLPAGGHEGEHDEVHTDHDGTETSHDGTETAHNGTESHDEHDHEGADPHFWMDPTRTADAVDAVEAAFAEVDPANEEAYAENATVFREELAALDDRIAEVVAAGSVDTLLVAGHDSFQYLAARYDIHVEALTGVSPDDRPTPRDIERAQEIIAEHDLRYVCADPLESQQAAEQLVAETDAEAVLPLTAMPGRTEAWAEKGWGYVEVMESVTLPTLERALET
ncbi:metal ABC transporter substrate-binding protein [Halolamina salifodinae]|uniref:Zinc transport system substrate-binding protein n=1 Tax=Halolamina salifodinae TaxID=1202767 RepID=A0A8T4H177_9EURY|nr:metal ABC transporter substrate-binding protein [Halolamina salifodinae]MBP1988103.1 zinc transport system substrate-binding protein [Halolamina salifodinae]